MDIAVWIVLVILFAEAWTNDDKVKLLEKRIEELEKR